MHYFLTFFLAIILIVISCEKESEDAPILKGTINGRIKIKDCYGYYLDDMAGVQINISFNTFSADTITDSEGNFVFENVPFGNYKLLCKKENFLQQTTHYTFGHVGGDVATTISEELREIPDFRLTLDSTELKYCLLYTWVKLSEASQTPYPYSNLCWLLMYFNDTPDVDSVNYKARTYTSLNLPDGNGNKVFFRLCESDVLEAFSSDSIYCRIYPAPLCFTSSEDETYSLPTGKSSNVFAFKRNNP